MSATTTAAPALLAISLGRSSNAIELYVPPAPAITAETALKARCFDHLSDLLFEHASLYSAAELIAAFNHIPGGSSNAAQEATSVCTSIRSEFFLIGNMLGLGFRGRDGKAIVDGIGPDAANRPPDLTYFAFRATVDPKTVDNRITTPSISIDFLLSLPQTASHVHANVASPSSRRVLFHSPNRANTPTTGVRLAGSPTISVADLYQMTAAEFNAIGCADDHYTLQDFDPDCISHFDPHQVYQMATRTPTQLPARDRSALSPRMNAVLGSPGNSGFSYHGGLDFLDSQMAFDDTFPNPIPVAMIRATNGSFSSCGIAIAKRMTTFLDTCKFCVFVPIHRLDYVGTSSRDDAGSLAATVRAIKALGMVTRSQSSNQWVHLTPDELYSAYSQFIPLLPPKIALWGFNLVSQFRDALTPELQDLIRVDRLYLPPDLMSLGTKTAQLSALRDLRIVAVRHFVALRSQEKMILKLMHRATPNNNHRKPAAAAATTTVRTPVLPTGYPPALPSVVDPSPSGDDVSAMTRTIAPPTGTHGFNSQAEHTMQRYQPQAPTLPPRAADYPVDPLTNFVSTFPTGFEGCMWCGSTDHKFRACPRRTDSGAADTFYKNLFAHKPHCRKRPVNPKDIITQSFSSQQVRLSTSSVPGGDSSYRPPTPPVPAPLFDDDATASIYTDSPSKSAMKKARFMVTTVQSFAAPTRQVLPPMPIAIDNGLPHISFDLGAGPVAEHKLTGLMDTCGALNTGYLLFHQFVMCQRPDLVADFLQFDDANPFEPVKLGGATLLNRSCSLPTGRAGH